MPELYFSQGYQKPSDFLSPLGPEKTVALCQANQMSENAWLEPAQVFSLSETLTLDSEVFEVYNRSFA